MSSTSSFLDLFESRRAELGNHEPDWLPSYRQAAISRFRAIGLPTRKNEAFKYTNVRKLASRAYRPAADAGVTADEVSPFLFAELGASLVFVDGRFRADLSSTEALPAGVAFGSMAQGVREQSARLQAELDRWPTLEHALFLADHGFTELNRALFEDGVRLHVPEGMKLEAPVQVLYLSTDGGPGEGPVATHTRNLLIADAGSEVTVLETHAKIGTGDSTGRLNNVLTDIFVGAGARLEHLKIQQEATDVSHFANVRAAQERGSHFETSFFSFGGALVRHEVELRLLDENCESALHGMYVSDGERQVDNYTTIHHAKPNCHSREVYKGVLADRAVGSFTGKIFVHEDAQKTDAEQSNDSLLLSRDASMNARPNLEIYADDVKCTHGATVGELDADQLFYLRARGIPESLARKLLVRAFAHEVIDGVPFEAVRVRLDELLIAALPEGSLDA